MVLQQNTVRRKAYYHMNTNNKSFLEMHYFLELKGITNSKFFLITLDPDLLGVDPHDPSLNAFMKTKILKECISNPFYFLREVVRIVDTGSPNGVPFKLHRGNLALIFCLALNLNIFLELPRQNGKTVSSLAWYLWLFNFGTANSIMTFMNKKHDDSKENLQTLKNMRELLPPYLRMDQQFTKDGKIIKASNTVETLQHTLNGNKIRTVASARNKVAAASLLRGRTTPLMYIDEFAFIQYNEIIYSNMVPAFNTAANNAKKNGAPFGILITTTPGMLTTDEGQVAFEFKESATPFCEQWYDLTTIELQELLEANTNSSFVYIRFTYQQLGRDEQWFKTICVHMRKKWADIRREVLLEWAVSSENCPFDKEDLETIRNLVKQPVSTVLLFKKYQLNIYEKIHLKYPPLIGVDVSGGYSRDSSAITVVDSNTTRVVADLNCNFIPTTHLASVIYEMVTQFYPNAIVNVERNGGFGASVLAKLVSTSIKKNLFYSIKDKVIEERFAMTGKVSRQTARVKVYGSDSTKQERENLMEILRDRVDYHKDKIVSPIIYQELTRMEVKKNGRIEHSSNSHDDQVFSWLWALYIYYYGEDLKNSFNITRRALKTDQELEEDYQPIEEKYADLTEYIDMDNEEVENQLSILNQAPGSKSYEEWRIEESRKDQEAMEKILQNKLGRDAFCNTYNYDREELEREYTSPGMTNIPMSVFNNFYED